MTEVETPWETDPNGGFTVTIKAGKGYDDPWLVIRDRTAQGIKRKLLDAYGADIADADELTVVALVHQLSSEFQAHGNVRREFPNSRVEVARESIPSPAKDPNAQVLAAIEAVTTDEELSALWREHGPFTDDVEKAWKAKGRALRNK